MKAQVGGWLGRWQYLRGKSAIYVEAARSWIMPASAVGAYVLYLTGSRRWSVALALLVPVIGEVAGFFLGRFLFNHGGVEAEYQMALDRDPYKRRTIEALERMSPPPVYAPPCPCFPAGNPGNCPTHGCKPEKRD